MEDDLISQKAGELQDLQKGIIEDAISQGIKLDMKNLGENRTICASVNSALALMRKDVKASILKTKFIGKLVIREDCKEGIEIG